MIHPARLPAVSPTARRLMRAHRPGDPAYLSWALGPVETAAALAPIDAAYADLVGAGLMAASEVAMTVLPGEVRHPLTLTAAGLRLQHLATT